MRTLLLFLCVNLTYLLTSCVPNRINLTEGVFGMHRPPSVGASERPLHDGLNGALALAANVGATREREFPGAVNLGFGPALDREPANIVYRIEGTDFGGFAQMAFKSAGSPWFAGMGLGYQGFPYAAFTVGHNRSFWEIAFTSVLGRATDTANYAGLEEYEKSCIFESDCTEGWRVRPFANSGQFTRDFLSANLHANLFWRGLALAWTGTVAAPWFDILYLPPGELELDFPLVFQNELALSYRFWHLRARVGVSRVSGLDATGIWGATAQLAWIL
jgi:hypothetical protein